MSKKIKMIGIGDEGRNSLLPIYEKWINECDVLIGGERHLLFFPDFKGEKVAIRGGLKPLVERLKRETKKVVILASGDPLFYGLGGYLSSKVELEIYPYLSSIQLAFAKMQESWQDAYFTSVHGRSMFGLAQRIDGKKKVVLLTDQENTPSRIARYLQEFCINEYKAFVAENLCGENEKYGWYEMEQLIDQEFSPLNIVTLKKVKNGPRWTFGIEDHEFYQRKPEKGLITKKEVRVLSLSSMCIQKDSIVWDIGACTGSVSIEAARLASEGAVYSIEKNEHDLQNLYQNIKKFRTEIAVKHGVAPEYLDEFPDPDAVFIGGTSGGMEQILDICCKRLKPDGRIVLNAATIESLMEAVSAFKQRNYEVSINLVQISRSKPILNLTRFEGLNPVYIVTAKHKEEKK